VTSLPRMLIALLVAWSLTGFIVAVIRSPTKIPGLAKRHAQTSDTLERLRSSLNPNTIVVGQALSLLTALLTAWFCRAMWPLALGALALVLPGLVLERVRLRRVERIESQLDTWMTVLASAVRSNPSLGEALASTLQITARPLRDEIDVALKEHRLGVTLDEAMARVDTRIGSRTFSAALLTLRVARAAGGDMSRCLESSASTLREMARLDAVVRTKTADGRAQATVISAMPFVLVALLHWVDPLFLAPLAQSTAGHAIIAVAIVIWLVAALLAYRIVQVDI
jgi:tight adherence protein B